MNNVNTTTSPSPAARSTSKWVVGLTIFMIFGSLGASSVALTTYVVDRKWRHDLIEHGLAGYNAKSGEFQLLGPKDVYIKSLSEQK